jgi:hypothetical protein
MEGAGPRANQGKLENLFRRIARFRNDVETLEREHEATMKVGEEPGSGSKQGWDLGTNVCPRPLPKSGLGAGAPASLVTRLRTVRRASPRLWTRPSERPEAGGWS